jgi:transposase
MAQKVIYVRSLTRAEGLMIQRILKRSKDPVERRRAEIILSSEQGDTSGEIAIRLHFTSWYVRKVIHAFNERGMESLKSQYSNGGRPPKVLPEHESELIDLALTPPNLTGQPFTHWSIKTLRDIAVKRGLIPVVTQETVRLVLKKYRISLQRTKTWKESDDPCFDEKKTR